jgi:drug/metabolite transporter (DMT)-like permease
MSRSKLVLAFLAVYIIWGSTYLAIRFGVESMPPFLMASVRFAIPGVALVWWRRARGAPAPTLPHWRSAAIVGALLLLGGNGIVTWAEQWVPSGLTALLIASVPLWMGVMNWMIEPAARPKARGIAGLFLGFAGLGGRIPLFASGRASQRPPPLDRFADGRRSGRAPRHGHGDG